MAFVPGCEHDIFISYAHVDDQPMIQGTEGWVTTFVKGLKNLLGKRLGRADAFSLWMDHAMAPHGRVSSRITETLEKTAVLVVVMSPGYLASEWCRLERSAFLEFVKSKATPGSSVFIVELDRVDPSDLPPEFDGLYACRFWVQDREGKPPRTLGMPTPTADDRSYFESLNDLAHAIEKELRSIRQARLSPEVRPEPCGSKPVVFLAETTDDLDSRREQVKRYLDQAGFGVLPRGWYRREPRAFEAALREDLSQCDFFVQLLSGAPGKKSPDLPQGYVKLQFECAKGADLPILQWRSRELDLDTVGDPVHARLLREETVLAVGMEEFKREVRRRVLEKPSSPVSPDFEAFVFVNSERSDDALARQVCGVLDQHRVAHALPLRQGKPMEIRKDLERNLQDCDALLVIYGDCTVTWVREQLRQSRKVMAMRERPMEAMAVYEGPPERKESLGFRLPGMQVLDCRGGLSEHELVSFLERVERRNAGGG